MSDGWRLVCWLNDLQSNGGCGPTRRMARIIVCANCKHERFTKHYHCTVCLFKPRFCQSLRQAPRCFRFNGLMQVLIRLGKNWKTPPLRVDQYALQKFNFTKNHMRSYFKIKSFVIFLFRLQNRRISGLP